MAYLILFSMLFLHLIADYNLQGVLAQFKQKKMVERELSRCDV